MSVKDMKQNNIPSTDVNNGLIKAQISTKFLFGQKVVILSGFFKGTKGWIMDFNQDSEDKIIGVPPYTQTIRQVTVIYIVRVGRHIDVNIPENNLKKALL